MTGVFSVLATKPKHYSDEPKTNYIVSPKLTSTDKKKVKNHSTFRTPFFSQVRTSPLFPTKKSVDDSHHTKMRRFIATSNALAYPLFSTLLIYLIPSYFSSTKGWCNPSFLCHWCCEVKQPRRKKMSRQVGSHVSRVLIVNFTCLPRMLISA